MYVVLPMLSVYSKLYVKKDNSWQFCVAGDISVVEDQANDHIFIFYNEFMVFVVQLIDRQIVQELHSCYHYSLNKN